MYKSRDWEIIKFETNKMLKMKSSIVLTTLISISYGCTDAVLDESVQNSLLV